MKTGIEFFLLLVALERILVVFLRVQRESRKEDYDRTGQPVVYRSLAKNLRRMSFTNSFFLLLIDRLQLTAVYCNPQRV